MHEQRLSNMLLIIHSCVKSQSWLTRCLLVIRDPLVIRVLTKVRLKVSSLFFLLYRTLMRQKQIQFNWVQPTTNKPVSRRWAAKPRLWKSSDRLTHRYFPVASSLCSTSPMAQLFVPLIGQGPWNCLLVPATLEMLSQMSNPSLLGFQMMATAQKF